MQPHASAYEAWAEAERIAGAAERALGDVLANNAAAPHDLLSFVLCRQRDASEALVKWFQALEEATVGMGTQPPH